MEYRRFSLPSYHSTYDNFRQYDCLLVAIAASYNNLATRSPTVTEHLGFEVQISPIEQVLLFSAPIGVYTTHEFCPIEIRVLAILTHLRSSTRNISRDSFRSMEYCRIYLFPLPISSHIRT